MGSVQSVKSRPGAGVFTHVATFVPSYLYHSYLYCTVVTVATALHVTKEIISG